MQHHNQKKSQSSKPARVEPKRKVLWLVWSIEHDAWWKPAHNGYTTDIKEAGRYPYPEARGIVEGANYGKYDRPNEALVPDYI